VWVLHLAYAWLCIHLALRLAACAGLVTPSLAIHALTVGTLGTMTLGMMTRTALGHTGRALQAGPLETTAYLLITLAACLRVAVPLAAPGWLPAAVGASSVAWALAFGLFLVRYAPWLWRPRADGQPG
jgi:uncharacterized protein involved in response to NO